MNVFPLSAAPFEARSRAVEFGNVFDWYRQGWAIFTVRPGRWLAMMIGALLTYLCLAQLPMVGWPVAHLLTPLLAAVFLLGCHDVASDAEPSNNGRLTMLPISCFQSLAVLGGLFLLGAMMIHRLLWLVTSDTSSPSVPSGLVLDTFPRLSDWMVIGVLGGLLSLPLLMAFWFAPALVVLNQIRPIAALHASFQACLKNVVALLVYGTILLALAFLALLPAGLGLLIFGPVLAGSVYAAYRDIFLAT